MGSKQFGQDVDKMREVAQDIKKVQEMGYEICLVVGGGNIYRGATAQETGMDRGVADYIGMLATVMNAVALQHILEQAGVETRVQSALPISAICEPYIRRKAIRHIEKGRVVLFAAGTGNPYFTTDTTAVLRAMEMNCDMVLKGTSVDGVYSADPKKHPDAVRYETISYQELIEKNLRIMDMSAVSMCRDNGLKISVFSIRQPEALSSLLSGKSNYTIIC